MTNSPRYIGRFAPSPTGPLHFGSLVCALGSYLDAVTHGGHWLVRMEDLDPPREEPGAADRILHSLEAHGLHWHGPVVWQSQRLPQYEDTLATLRRQGATYDCYCTRAQIRGAGGHQNRACRAGELSSADETTTSAATRLKCAGTTETFTDLWHQQQVQPLTEDTILKRRDGLHAYQLAVVVDDIAAGITHIVRGADLLETTSAQQHLFRVLGAAPPQFGHLPLVMGKGGQKLSKQNHAPAIENQRASENLCAALAFLGFHVDKALAEASPSEILHWALARWQRLQVDRHNRMAEPIAPGRDHT